MQEASNLLWIQLMSLSKPNVENNLVSFAPMEAFLVTTKSILSQPSSALEGASQQLQAQDAGTKRAWSKYSEFRQPRGASRTGKPMGGQMDFYRVWRYFTLLPTEVLHFHRLFTAQSIQTCAREEEGRPNRPGFSPPRQGQLQAYQITTSVIPNLLTITKTRPFLEPWRFTRLIFNQQSKQIKTFGTAS